MVEKDEGAAAKWVSELADGILRNAVLDTLITAVAATDPQYALTLLTTVPTSKSPWARIEIVQSIFEKWAERDPRDAAAAAAQLGASFRDNASYFVGMRWANADINGALAWALSQATNPAESRLRESSFTRNALTGVVSTWMHMDAEAAMKWLSELPEGNQRANLIQSTFLLTEHEDPARAIQLAMMIPPGVPQEVALQDATRSWAQFDPAGALAWVTQQPDEHVRQTALKVIATQWINSDPKGATNG